MITSMAELRRAAKPHTVQMLTEARPSARERGYDTAWEKFSRDYRARNPLCVECLRKGITSMATVVDHKRRLRDCPELKFDKRNLQSLCTACHNAKTRAESRLPSRQGGGSESLGRTGPGPIGSRYEKLGEIG